MGKEDKTMIRDRGRIKWTSLMLPEHVKMLRDWANEDMWEKTKEIDEQKLEEMNETMKRAIELKQKVAVYHYNNNEYHYEVVTGTIHSYDLIIKELQLIDEKGEIHEISLKQINDIDLVD
jgi:hypothetical protein